MKLSNLSMIKKVLYIYVILQIYKCLYQIILNETYKACAFNINKFILLFKNILNVLFS